MSLTPPQETNPNTSSEMQEDEDIDFLKNWLRCQGVKIDTFISKYNRAAVPIEEDIRVLGPPQGAYRELTEDCIH